MVARRKSTRTRAPSSSDCRTLLALLFHREAHDKLRNNHRQGRAQPGCLNRCLTSTVSLQALLRAASLSLLWLPILASNSSSSSGSNSSLSSSSNSLISLSRDQAQHLVLLSCKVSCSQGLALLWDIAAQLDQCTPCLRLLSRHSRVPVIAGVRWISRLRLWGQPTQTWALPDSSSSSSSKQQ